MQLQLRAAPLKQLHRCSAPRPKAGSHAWEEPTLPHDIWLWMQIKKIVTSEGGGGLTPTRKLTSRVRTEVMAFEDGQWSGFYRSEQLLCCKSVCIQELFPCWSKHE